MSPVRKIPVKNFVEFVEAIEKLRAAHPNSQLWFRGCMESSYELIPSFYRGAKKSIVDLVEQEKRMISTYYYRTMPFRRDSIGKEGWEILFLMQHFGVPTRLLDWTENPFIALFFGIGSNYTFGIDKYTEDASVWVIEPQTWNHNVLNMSNNTVNITEVFEPDNSHLYPYRPIVQNANDLPLYPLAMYGAHNNQRIVSQRGVFMVFGSDKKSMKDIYLQNLVHGSDYLYEIMIEKDCIINLRESLKYSGFAESMIYPDLDHLAEEIKRDFGF